MLLALAACGSDPAPAPLPSPVGEAVQAKVPAEGDRAGAPALNHAPEIHSVRFEPEKPGTGETVRAVVDASDADGDSIFLRYEWTLGDERLDIDVPKLVLTGASRGQRIGLRVTASDGRNENNAVELSSEVRNLPPKLTKLTIEPPDGVLVGVRLVVRPEARDPDGDRVSFRYEWSVNGRPAIADGATLDTSKLSRRDKVRVVVFASDGEDESEGLASPELLVVNAPPHVVSRPGPPGADGVFRYQVKAEDPDGDGQNLQFQLVSPPEGMKIDAATGEITWQPAPGQTGTWSVTVLVNDLEGGAGRQIFEVSAGTATAAPAAVDPDAKPERGDDRQRSRP